MTKLSALTAAYESAKTRFPAGFSFSDFEKMAEGWEVFPVLVGGDVVGAVLRNGPELHACIKPEGFKRWMGKAQIRLIEETIEKHGYALTRVQQGNEIGAVFVKRLGFKASGTEDGSVVYIKVKHGN